MPLRSNGVPEGMLMDHGIPWWSATAATGMTELTCVADEARHRAALERDRHPQTQGKVERFHGELERALQRRGWQGKSPQQWLDEFRWEHNQVRPHEALQMRTPASVWRPSGEATIRIRRAGSIRREPRCGGWMGTAS